MRRAALAAFALTAGVGARAARGEPRVAVAVMLDAACAIDDPDAVMRAVRVELGDDAVTAVADAGVTRATVTCTDGAARIRVVEPRAGRVIERDVALADIPAGARARTLAVAVTELIAASTVAPPAVRAPPAPRPPRVAAAPGAAPLALAAEPAPPRAASRGFALDAAIGERHHGNGLAVRGAAVRGWYRRGWLELGLGGEVAVGGRDLDAGRVDVQLWTLGALALARVELDHLTLAAGVGASAGVAHVDGDFTAAPAPELLGVVEARGVIIARARATARWSLHLALEVGGVVAGVETWIGDRVEPVYRGGFAGLSTGVGVAF